MSKSKSDPDAGPRRLIPALPPTDPQLGEIRWGPWEKALLVTHIDPSCDVCDYPGPLRTAMGMTLHQDPPRRALLKRSRIAQGQRPVWGPVKVPAPRWVYSHWAVRCPHCDVMTAWRCFVGKKEWVEVGHHPPTTERALPAQEGTLF